MRKVCTGLVLLVALLTAVACGKELPRDDREEFAALVPIPMDTGLRLELLKIRDASSAMPAITVLIKNYSNDQVWFLAPAYGARLFVYSESVGQWIEVPDCFVSVEEKGVILAPKGQGSNWGAIVSVCPSLPPWKAPSPCG